MATIKWSDEDILDPYPAILKTLGKVFKFACSDKAMNMGGSEPDIINTLYKGCIGSIITNDPDSLDLIDSNRRFH